MRYRERVYAPGTSYLFGQRPFKRTMNDDPTFTGESTFKRMDFSEVKTTGLEGGSASVQTKDYLGNWGDPIDLSVRTPLGCEKHAFLEQPAVANLDGPFPPEAGFFMKDLSDFGKSKANLPVMLVELRKTYQMLRNPFKLASFLAKPPKGLRLPRNFREATAVASPYLEARYGWRPFLADIRNLRGSVSRFDAAKPFLDSGKPFVYKSTRSNSVSGTRVKNYPYPTYDMRTNVSVSTTWTAKRCEFGRAVKSASFDSQSIFRRIISAYGGDQLVGIAWELVPYSFVVDMFLPVGDLIDAHLGAPAWFTSTGSPWYWDYNEVVHDVSRTGVSNTKCRTSVGWSYKTSRKTFVRGPIVSVPQKPLNISGLQTADLLALAGQSLGRFLGKSS